ncbi:hypothetical protein [uncultured Pelagimonas sp.]|uniref:hypothetical protein n=1 Tax=uncultured Pelagimonas sp. TaxID=1618102 RepID=UPI00262E0693|nr:hypothetical protein [uncultured Pelagimonas sp.]
MERAEKDPVLIRAKEDVQRLEEQREEIAQELDDLTTEIRELRARIRNGDPERKGESGKLLGDVKYWLKAAREARTEFDCALDGRRMVQEGCFLRALGENEKWP